VLVCSPHIHWNGGDQVNRRDFMGLFGGAAVSPLLVQAQSPTSAKVGIVYPGLPGAATSRVAAFREGLRAGRWSDERVELLLRVASGDAARTATMTAELVRERVDVLVPVSWSAVHAAWSATKTIPTVAFDLETDPVASGLAASLAHPGGTSLASSSISPTSA
jgi:putative ABC transport system substrate-binding protein